jgi:Zn-dependent protease
MIIDSTIILLIASLCIGLFILINRKKFKFEGLKLFGWPILFLALYQSTWGIDTVRKIAQKHNKLIKILGYVCIVIGFIMMLLMSYLLVSQVVSALHKPEIAKTQPSIMMVLPIPNVKYAIYVPLVYWILTLFIVAFIHEFGHALLTAAHNVPLKNAGIAFMCFLIPIIPAAYVEPDMDELKKRPASQRLSVMSAGAGFNIMLCIAAAIIYFPMRLALGANLFWLTKFFGWLFVLNLGVGSTNLLPIVPLDGAHMINVLGKKWLTVATTVIMLGVIVFSIMQSFVL